MISLVIEAVVRSMALGLVLWLALTLTRSRNPHVHKMLWSTVLMASLIMPLVMRARFGPVIHAPDVALTLRALRGDSISSSPWHPAWSALSVLYLSLALLLLVRFAGSLWRTWQIQRTAEVVTDTWAAGMDVRVTARIVSPATFGSTILLPTHFSDWSAQKLQAVLAHERAHVQQWDCYVLWLARLHTCLFWINPMAWWLQHRLACLAETTSDEAGVAALGDPAGYAEMLLEFATLRAASDVATAMARRARISGRIERILSEIAPSAAPNLAKRTLVLAALLPAVAATAAPLGSAPPVQLSPAAAIKTPYGFPGLEKYYPKEALRRGIDGLVQIQVTLDAQGHATDTLILSEDPLNMGFGAAASMLAHVYEYDNPTGRPAQLTFNVKFELQQDHPTYGTTNFEEPASAKGTD
jgi:beta-lactamase regulating signal transducer with metallopeptidase domain